MLKNEKEKKVDNFIHGFTLQETLDSISLIKIINNFIIHKLYNKFGFVRKTFSYCPKESTYSDYVNKYSRMSITKLSWLFGNFRIIEYIKPNL